MSENDFERLKLLYEEMGHMFRFYLTWRQLLLAGYFAIVAALAIGYRWTLQNAPEISFVCPFGGAAISVLFWALDYRNRQLYNFTGTVGSELEKKLGFSGLGYYGAYSEGVLITHGRITHSKILSIFYIGFCIIMLLIGILAVVGVVPKVEPPTGQ